MKTTLVLPVYNEGGSGRLNDLIEKASKYVDEIIAIDDGSKDNTYNELKKSKAIALKHAINLGKAGAMKTGIEAAIKRGADILVLMDSDGQHRPEDLPRFIRPLKEDGLDVVLGGRKGGDKMPFFRKLGNDILEWSARFLFGLNVKDIQSGYRAFTREAYEKLRWNSTRYHADAEMTIRMGKYHLKYKQIFIDTIYHDDFKGMGVMDGLGLLFQIFIWRFKL